MGVVTVRVVRELDQVDREAWNALDHGPSPFLRWGFLRALEQTCSIGGDSGWDPFFVMAFADDGGLVGATAAFVKTDSYGEFIFDWNWAYSCERARIPYYPKLVVAAPVTPATGRRFLIAPGHDRDAVTAALTAGVVQVAEQTGCWSIHVLFCTADEAERLVELDFAARDSFQYHWHNRGYGGFDDFLAALTSRRRKQFRKERRRALDQIDRFEFVAGADLDADTVATMDRFYRQNVHAHGGYDYLRPGFFERLREHMPEALLFGRAVRGGGTIAGAIFLETDGALYGRYWGCDRSLDMLHFEVAYYAGIERAITRGLPLFEAGAQGEHKLLRGFEPSRTHSAHWFRHRGFDRAIREFLQEEKPAVAQRMLRLADHGPYRDGDADVAESPA